MKNARLLAVMVYLVATLGACRQDNRAEKLAALDNAYQAGVISKPEYDAKRQALGGAAAPPASTPAPQPVSPPAAAPTPPVPAAPPPAPVPEVAPRKPAAPVVAEAKPIPPLPSSPEPQAPPAQAAPKPPSRAPSPDKAAEPRPVAGCSDIAYRSGDVKGARQRFFPAPVAAVKKAAREAMGTLDFNIHDDSGNEMEASRRRHIGAVVGAGGERLLLRFENSHQGNETGTLVTAETKKSLVGRLAQKSWTNAVLAQIGCHLRAGR